MKLEDFELHRNRQRPDFCFNYEFKTKNRKYSIFTMNGGKTFLASIEEKRLNGKYYPEFSKTVNSIEEGLIVLSTNLILGWLWEEK